MKLINVGEAAKDGRRIVSFELSGTPREATTLDRSLNTKVVERRKADASDPMELGAPIPGMISSLECGVGKRVEKGEKVLTLEAMKMQTTLYAPATGVIAEVLAEVGEAVDAGDLLIKMRS